MILYHGSNVKVTKINLKKCRPFKDFGLGFYVTAISKQAHLMARRVARMYGGSPIVSKFKLDSKIYDEQTLRLLSFDKPSQEWALFVINNRDRNFADMSNLLSNRDNKYDMVFGPVANDDLTYLFRIFRSRLIDSDALLGRLEYKTLTNQYSFHTLQVLAYLKPEV
ncbi:MAG: DUF3990 domain-containing protein [Deltaproteobacteria bacterium]|jgi:hypothetical protein|nr:DUF3990 domain-containing protein [Deltaproteobacteria bacterium]